MNFYKLIWYVPATEGGFFSNPKLVKIWSPLVINVTGYMCSDAFKKARLQLFSNDFGVKQLVLTTVYIFKALEYKAV